MQRFQVALLGLNSLFGRVSSLLLKQSSIVKRLCLYDEHNIDSAKDIAVINTSCHVEAFLGKERLNDAVKDADVVIIGDESLSTPHTAFDLMAPKICDYAKAIASSSPNAIVVVAASPMNVLVPLISEALIDCGCYDCNKVIGATAVDNTRANCILAAHMKANPQKVVLPVVGGSSKETRVPLFSQARPLVSLADSTKQKLIQNIKESDNTIFTFKKIPEALNKAYTTFLFLNSVLGGLRGETNNISIAFTRTSQIPTIDYFALPVQFGRFGIEQRYGLPKVLPFEKELINESISYLKGDIEKAKLFYKTRESATETCGRNVSNVENKLSEKDYFDSFSIKEWEKSQGNKVKDVLVFKKPEFSNSKLYKSLSSLSNNIMIQPWDKPFDTKSFCLKYAKKVASVASSLTGNNSESLAPLNVTELNPFENNNTVEKNQELEFIKTNERLLSSLHNPVERIPNYSPQNALLGSIQNKTPEKNVMSENNYSDVQPSKKSVARLLKNDDIENAGEKMPPLISSNTDYRSKLLINLRKRENTNKIRNDPKLVYHNKIPEKNCSRSSSRRYRSSYAKIGNSSNNRNVPTKSKCKVPPFINKNSLLHGNLKTGLNTFSKSKNIQQNELLTLKKNKVPKEGEKDHAKTESPTYDAFIKQMNENSLKKKITLTKLKLRGKQNNKDNMSKTKSNSQKINIWEDSKTTRRNNKQFVNWSKFVNHVDNNSRDIISENNELQEDSSNHFSKDNYKEIKDDSLRTVLISETNKEISTIDIKRDDSTTNFHQPNKSKHNKHADEKPHLKWEKLFLGRKMSSKNSPFKNKYIKKSNEYFKSKNISLTTSGDLQNDSNTSSSKVTSFDTFQNVMDILDEEVYSEGIIGDTESANKNVSTICNTEDNNDPQQFSISKETEELIETFQKDETSTDSSKINLSMECKSELNENEPKIFNEGTIMASKSYLTDSVVNSLRTPLVGECKRNMSSYDSKNLSTTSSMSKQLPEKCLDKSLTEKSINNEKNIGSLRNNHSSGCFAVSKHKEFQNVQEVTSNSSTSNRKLTGETCNECKIKVPDNKHPIKVNCLAKTITNSAIHRNYLKFQKKRFTNKILFNKVLSSSKKISLSSNVQQITENKPKKASTPKAISRGSNLAYYHGKKEKSNPNKAKHNIKSSNISVSRGSRNKADNREFVIDMKKGQGAKRCTQAIPIASFNPTISKDNEKCNINTYTEKTKTFKSGFLRNKSDVCKHTNKNSNISNNQIEKSQQSESECNLNNDNIDKINEELNAAIDNNDSSDFKKKSPSRTFFDIMESKLSKCNHKTKSPKPFKKHKTLRPPPPQNLLEVIQKHYEKKREQCKQSPVKTAKHEGAQEKGIISENSLSKGSDFQLKDAFLEKIIMEKSPQVSQSNRGSTLLECKSAESLNIERKSDKNKQHNDDSSKGAMRNSTLKFIPLKMVNRKRSVSEDILSKDVGASACSFLLREKFIKIHTPFYKSEWNKPKESDGTLSQSKVCEDFPASSNIENLYSQYTRDFIKVENSRTPKIPSLSFLRSQNL